MQHQNAILQNGMDRQMTTLKKFNRLVESIVDKMKRIIVDKVDPKYHSHSSLIEMYHHQVSN